jgi:peptide-methionine (R)-S-oxide reductase
MRTLFLFIVLFTASFMSCNSQKHESTAPKTPANTAAMKDTTIINRSEEEWKQILTPEQFSVLRMKGTDRAFTGKYYLTNEKGVYSCAGCGEELFTSDMKFASECGWPSFDRAMEGGKIKTVSDFSHGMVRTEIICAKCGGHLGHLFDDGPTKTGLRYCVNSTSLNFVKEKK